jgi:hypothetical protein
VAEGGKEEGQDLGGIGKVGREEDEGEGEEGRDDGTKLEEGGREGGREGGG